MSELTGPNPMAPYAARYWELRAAADAAWQQDNMAEWEALLPRIEEAAAQAKAHGELNIQATQDYGLFR